MKRAGTFSIIENWEIKTVDCFGNIVEKEEVCNLITNVGLNLIRDLIGNLNTAAYERAIAIGTGSTAAANADTALQTEYARAAATVTAPVDYQIKFAHTFTFASGVSENITEAGLLNNSTSGGSLLARTVFAAKAVTVDVSLIITATLTIARG